MAETKRKNTSNKVGEVNKNKYGNSYEITRFKNTQDLDVKFDDGFELKHRSYRSFSNGGLYSIFDKTVFGVGYLGTEEYSCKTYKYKVWVGMLRRCYSKVTQINQPTYKGCTVCEEWHNFHNFEKWYDENYYEIDGEKSFLDKDIIDKDNKIYCPEKCVFVNRLINNIFTNKKSNKGDLPTGISRCSTTGKYKVEINKYGIHNYLGLYTDLELAEDIYINSKKLYVQEIAEYYKNKIPNRLYLAMYNYYNEKEVD